jgi:RNAse (barnase) inhibitor barstar
MIEYRYRFVNDNFNLILGELKELGKVTSLTSAIDHVKKILDLYQINKNSTLKAYKKICRFLNDIIYVNHNHKNNLNEMFECCTGLIFYFRILSFLYHTSNVMSISTIFVDTKLKDINDYPNESLIVFNTLKNKINTELDKCRDMLKNNMSLPLNLVIHNLKENTEILEMFYNFWFDEQEYMDELISIEDPEVWEKYILYYVSKYM